MSRIILTTISTLLLISCQAQELKVIADLPSYLKEISAVETTKANGLLWVIQDSGNKNAVYGLDLKGKLKKTIIVENANNQDWEDLTSDEEGNLYIGDFGNNNFKRNTYTIYKIKNPESAELRVNAEVINFSLDNETGSLDFEAFFFYNELFYLISKSAKSSLIFTIPNENGNHIAKRIDNINLKGGRTKITSADISPDGKTIVFLTHNRIWISTVTGDIVSLEKNIKGADNLDHTSQKEGICFKDDTTVYITDEKNKNSGGNLYEWTLKK